MHVSVSRSSVVCSIIQSSLYLCFTSYAVLDTVAEDQQRCSQLLQCHPCVDAGCTFQHVARDIRRPSSASSGSSLTSPRADVTWSSGSVVHRSASEGATIGERHATECRQAASGSAVREWCANGKGAKIDCFRAMCNSDDVKRSSSVTWHNTWLILPDDEMPFGEAPAVTVADTEVIYMDVNVKERDRKSALTTTGANATTRDEGGAKDNVGGGKVTDADASEPATPTNVSENSRLYVADVIRQLIEPIVANQSSQLQDDDRLRAQQRNGITYIDAPCRSKNATAGDTGKAKTTPTRTTKSAADVVAINRNGSEMPGSVSVSQSGERGSEDNRAHQQQRHRSAMGLTMACAQQVRRSQCRRLDRRRDPSQDDAPLLSLSATVSRRLRREGSDQFREGESSSSGRPPKDGSGAVVEDAGDRIKRMTALTTRPTGSNARSASDRTSSTDQRHSSLSNRAGTAAVKPPTVSSLSITVASEVARCAKRVEHAKSSDLSCCRCDRRRSADACTVTGGVETKHGRRIRTSVKRLVA